ncbi:MAG: AbiV family abortive infection protein [Myxococcales bacterium]|nr:AbiV family abortive infection protein [Myxococcales bacterium]
MAAETSPFKASAEACVENAKRLMETADDLLWTEHLGPACALAITAQEELAKAFLLNLVADGAIPWCEPVKRALKDHICKQVATVIMEWLTPSFEIQSVRMRASEVDPEFWTSC